MREYELFSRDTQAVIYNNQRNAVQRMLDFDALCERKTPSVACIVNETRGGFEKFFFGRNELLIPMYRTLEEALERHPNVDVMINFASFRSAYATSKKALESKKIRTVAIIAEGVPERRARELAALARKNGKVIIGPSTVGGLTAGAFKIGNTAGTIENIFASRLYRPGCVGFVSKSGGMLNEAFNIISRNSNGVYEGIAIGGDKYPGSTLMDHVVRYEKNPNIKMIVVLGELGGKEEYRIVDAMKAGKVKKPLVAWVTGTCAKVFPSEVQFGHAGAKAGAQEETADAKNAALKAAGAIVPKSFDDFDDAISKTYQSLKKKGIAKDIPDKEGLTFPLEFNKAVKAGVVRKPTSFICTISDERGDEHEYLGKPITEIIAENRSIGDIVAMLWFGRELPKWATNYIELIVKIVADHGPAVSGAHNAIVASRAGKDVISCLCSGLLTIGPRFGGAIDGAAKYMKDACDAGMTPEQFVRDMKDKGILIPGIGHRIKSLENPDKRVELLKNYVKKNFPKTKYLDYAIEVEQVTTKKRNTLILNVDGCVGVTFVDLMNSVGFSQDEISRFIDMGVLNALFVWGRSIGFIGHILDQKRLDADLYRHPWDDILFIKPEKKSKGKN
ncbi:MAG: citrate/2-methylcitrate synthase [archaeon]